MCLFPRFHSSNPETFDIHRVNIDITNSTNFNRSILICFKFTPHILGYRVHFHSAISQNRGFLMLNNFNEWKLYQFIIWLI